jgi:hypothetical protein
MSAGAISTLESGGRLVEEEAMPELKTDEALLRALERAAARPLTEKEIHSQRGSFIMGTIKDNSTITRARVERVLAEQEGRKVAS